MKKPKQIKPEDFRLKFTMQPDPKRDNVEVDNIALQVSKVRWLKSVGGKVEQKTISQEEARALGLIP